MNNGKYKFNIKENIGHISKHSMMAIFLLLFYLPIMIMVMFAFNDGKSIFTWQGFSFRWFEELFQDQSFINALLITLIVSITSTTISTVIGTLAAIGLHNSTKNWFSKSLESITNYPIFIADVIMGISLMILFILLGFNFGIITMILGHVMFTTPYVIIAIMPKLKQVGPEMVDASFDLGASPMQTLRKILIPILKPGIVAGAAIAFAMSFDDFIISYFIGGSSENLSVWIYNLKKLVPIINAFSVFLILGVIIFFISKSIQEQRKFIKENQELIWMKKALKVEQNKEIKLLWKRENKKSIRNYFYIRNKVNKDLSIKIKLEEMKKTNFQKSVKHEN